MYGEHVVEISKIANKCTNSGVVNNPWTIVEAIFSCLSQAAPELCVCGLNHTASFDYHLIA